MKSLNLRIRRLAAALPYLHVLEQPLWTGLPCEDILGITVLHQNEVHQYIVDQTTDGRLRVAAIQ